MNHRAAFGVGAWVLCSLVIISGVSEAASRHGLRGHIKAPDCPAQVTNQAPPPFAVLRAGEAITVDFLAAPERGISTRIGSDGRIYWPYSAPVLIADLDVVRAEQALRAAVQNVFFDPDLRIGLAPSSSRLQSAPQACAREPLANPDLAQITSEILPQTRPDRLAERGSDDADILPRSQPFIADPEDELAQIALHESIVVQPANIASEDGSDPAAVATTEIVPPKPANMAPIAESVPAAPVRIETGAVRIERDKKKTDWFGAPRARSQSPAIIP